MSYKDDVVIDFIEEADRKRKLARETGDIFSEIRSDQGLTQREAAEKLSTTQCVISNLEKGEWDPKLSTLTKYARAYGYTVQLNFEPIEE